MLQRQDVIKLRSTSSFKNVKSEASTVLHGDRVVLVQGISVPLKVDAVLMWWFLFQSVPQESEVTPSEELSG
jgi:hypothetical protein